MSGVSVVIRAKNEEHGIGRTLELLDAQSRRPDEVIVVDSGSTDATPQIVRGAGATLIEIPAATFTYGGALNTGCEAASGDVLVALSAHAYPEDRDWIAMLASTLEDDRVACATGVDHDPDGAPLTGPLRQDAQLVRHNPFWGYSNAAGAFRASLWRERPWRVDMPWTEDKEWALYWLERGYVCVVDPRLRVAHSHTSDPAREQFRRARLEWVGLGMFIPVDPHPLGDLAREWWSEQETYPNAWRARLAPNRLARLAGKWAGRRRRPARCRGRRS